MAKKSDRIDRLLRESDFPGKKWLSRSALEELIQAGRVQAAGKRVVRPGLTVFAGTELALDLPPLGLLPGTLKAEPVWLDQEHRLGLFAKRAGIPTYPLLPWMADTFANEVAAFAADSGWISLESFTELAEPPKLEGGLLQRLDSNTSGLIAVAFDSATKEIFRNAFSAGRLEKRYRAIVQGDFAAAKGRHQFVLRPAAGGKKMMAVAPDGESDVSELEVSALAQSKDFALVEVHTRQGARHVVRASLAALGVPLVGDALYGGNTEVANFHQLHAGRTILLDASLFPAFPSDLELPAPQSFLDCAAKLGLH